MKGILKYALLAVGVLIGSLHLWLAIKAMFVFRNEEPISMWIFVFSGPLSTLPAIVTGFFSPTIGSSWLICGSIVSLVAAFTNVEVNKGLQEMIWYFTSYSAPMLVLGIALLLAGNNK